MSSSSESENTSSLDAAISEVRFKNVEEYEISEGSSNIRILWDNEENEYIYSVLEPELSPFEMEELDRITKEMEQVIPNSRNFPKEYSTNDTFAIIDSFMKSRNIVLDEEIKKKFQYFFQRDYNGFGKIDPMFKDNFVEDISCDGPQRHIFVYHRKYGSLKSSVLFKKEAELNSYIIRLAQICGKEVSVNNPILDGVTPEGHRIQGTYGHEISPNGSTFTVRLYREKPFTPVELIAYGTASPEIVAYLWYMIENLSSALIAGPPAVGKTSALNSILMLVPQNTKVFSIEETREINIMHKNWVATTTREGNFDRSYGTTSPESKIDLFDLVKMGMRQRPTYIVVGEVRGREAYSLFQAMSTGHTTYSTIHADSIETMVHRLESEPLNIPRVLISYLNIAIFLKFIRSGNKTVRKITEIDEISGIDGETIELLYNKVFSYDSSDDSQKYMGFSNLYKKVRSVRNLSEKDFLDEFNFRVRLLSELAKNEVMDYKNISKIVENYYRDPESALRMAKGDLD